MGTQLLIVSDGSLTTTDRVVDTVHHHGVVTHVVDSPSAALARLRAVPTLVAIDAHLPGAETFVSQLRSEGALAGIPLVALTRDATDAAFGEALSWGVDEVVPLDGIEHLGTLALALGSSEPSTRPAATRGTVLVACATPENRRMRARPLRNVGYEVLFAADPDELAGSLDRPDLRFIVAELNLFGPDGAHDVQALYHADSRHRPWVIVVPAPRNPALARSLAPLRVAVVDSNAPPEDAIFAGNELLRGGNHEARASARLLHATVVSVRPAGTRKASFGVTYNVSREGLYVRTVTPPPPGQHVWLELRPMLGDTLVHLDAEVRWVRPFGPREGATAPAGFGAHITGSSRHDLEQWNLGYGHLLGDRASAFPSTS